MTRGEKVFFVVFFVIAEAMAVVGIVKMNNAPKPKYTPQVISTEEITTPLNVDRVFVVHDDKRNVTCYVTVNKTAISCIPDAKMKAKE